MERGPVNAPGPTGRGSQGRLRSVNPATCETLREYAAHDLDECAGRLAAAAIAGRDWRRASFADRARIVRGAAKLLRDRAAGYARLATLEMGKPLAQAEA